MLSAFHIETTESAWYHNFVIILVTRLFELMYFVAFLVINLVAALK